MKTLRLVPAAAALAFGLTACDSARRVDEADRTFDASGNACAGCHGDPNRPGSALARAAPPRDASGRTDGPRVGAHQAHVGRGFLCENCHQIPDALDTPGHMVDLAEGDIRFGPAAIGVKLHPTDPDRVPAYSRATGTCSNVYCHNPSPRAGGATPAPVWFGVLDAGPCASCHGAPPPSHQPTATRCWECHPATVADPANGQSGPPYTIIANGGHMNRSLDLSIERACSACHGDPARSVTFSVNRAAPPPVAPGRTTGPGAHLKHVEPQAATLWLPGFGLPVPAGNTCATCHVGTLPTSLDHVDGAVSIDPAHGWDSVQRSCATARCHGVGLETGAGAQPRWDLTGEAVCGSCHTLPPQNAPHPQVDLNSQPIVATTQCNQCHPGTVDEAGLLDRDLGLHVNGRTDQSLHPDDWAARDVQLGFTPHGLAALSKAGARGGLVYCGQCHGANLDGGRVGVSCDGCHDVDGNGTPDAGWRTSCTFCHGDVLRAANRPAPPTGTQGETARTSRAVGAHQIHLGNGSVFSNGVSCSECHQVPQPDATSLAHVNRVVTLTFGAVASSRGANPAFDEGALTCTNACHGQTLPGATGRTSPVWIVDAAISCSTCHQSSPTTGQHPAVQGEHGGFACAVCHMQDYAGTGPKTNHVNGTVNVDTGGVVRWNPVDRSCAAACHGGDSRSWN